MTKTNDTFKIALDCVYDDANLVAYQINPEVFEWMTMYNYKVRPDNIEVDERLAPFMMISFDYGNRDLGTAADFMTDFFNDIMGIADHFANDFGNPDSMRIKKTNQAKTSHYHELISYNY